MTFPNPPCPRCGSLTKRHDERRCFACFAVWRPLLLVAAQESGERHPAIHQCYGCHYTWSADSEIVRLTIAPLDQPSRCSVCGHWWEPDRCWHLCPGARGALDTRTAEQVRQPLAPPSPTQRKIAATAGRAILNLLDGATKTALDTVAEELGQPRGRLRRRGG